VSGTRRIAVVDYGAGNLVSIDQAFTSVGAAVTVVRDGEMLRDVDALVVPGVGAAAPAMARLEQHGLTGPIGRWLASGRPFLGICLGLQLLFEASDEDGAVTLGALAGRTVRLEDAPTLPHIGWNQVERTRDHPLFEGIADGADFYFVHSYAGDPIEPDEAAVLARTTHGRPFVSAIARGPVQGVQFHPERSGPDGLRLIANFVAMARAA
jgi:glutamine amidotransferase